MKQKIVIKVDLNDKKCCTKAIQTAVGVDGVVQASLQREKNQIEVTGEGIDVVLLATLLRKSLRHAEVLSVSPVEDNKPSATNDQPSADQQINKLVWTFGAPATYYDHIYAQPAYAYNGSPSCSIL